MEAFKTNPKLGSIEVNSIGPPDTPAEQLTWRRDMEAYEAFERTEPEGLGS
jgi:hypothetical protein